MTMTLINFFLNKTKSCDFILYTLSSRHLFTQAATLQPLLSPISLKQLNESYYKSPSGLHDEPLFSLDDTDSTDTDKQQHSGMQNQPRIMFRPMWHLALPCTSLLNQSSQHASAVVLRGLLHHEGAEGSLLSQQI